MRKFARRGRKRRFSYVGSENEDAQRIRLCFSVLLRKKNMQKLSHLVKIFGAGKCTESRFSGEQKAGEL